MGAPFPMADQIVMPLAVEECLIGGDGFNFGDSMVLIERGWLAHYHETAHFYLTPEMGSSRHNEGVARFAAEHTVAQIERAARWRCEFL